MSLWFDRRAGPWSTCPVSEAGFVRVSSNPRVVEGALPVADALDVLRGLRGLAGHRFLTNDVSPADADWPGIGGHRQVPDAVLLTVARRAGVRLVTFDAALAALGREDVELLRR